MRIPHLAGVADFIRAGADWIVSLPTVDGSVRFESVNLSIAFDEVYAGAEL